MTKPKSNRTIKPTRRYGRRDMVAEEPANYATGEMVAEDPGGCSPPIVTAGRYKRRDMKAKQ